MSKYHSEAIAKAADEALEALDNLRHALNYTELGRDLRQGGDLPYSLRNFISELQGSDGGWLMREGESFYEQLATIKAIAGGGEDGEPVCKICGDNVTVPEAVQLGSGAYLCAECYG